MEGEKRELLCSGISMRSRLGELLLSEWRFSDSVLKATRSWAMDTLLPARGQTPLLGVKICLGTRSARKPQRSLGSSILLGMRNTL